MKNILQEIPNKNIHGRLLYSTNFVDDKDIEGKQILDIGCGYGWFEMAMLKRKAKKIVGIDITKDDIETAKKHVISDRVTFTTGDALNLPFPDKSFDTVVAWELLEHLPKGTEEQFFKEVKRVLKKNGVFYLSTPNNDFFAKIFDPAWWLKSHRHYFKQKLDEYGFSCGFQTIKQANKGRFWEIVGTNDMYFSKWVLHKHTLFGDFISQRQDAEYRNSGFTTIYMKYVNRSTPMQPSQNRLKNIVPGLVSIETNLKYLRGFYLSDNFYNYPDSDIPSELNYKLVVKEDINIPNEYDFRNGYYFKSGTSWYYYRKIGPIELKFQYDLINKVFYYNQIYSLIPFEVGHIFPVGRHIADLINLDLFLNEHSVVRGCVFRHKNKVYCIIAPRLNGKTTFVNHMVRKGGVMIASDMFVLDLLSNTIYPCNPCIRFFAKDSDKKLKDVVNINGVTTGSYKIDELYLVQNSTTINYTTLNKSFFHFYFLNSLSFLKNYFIKSYMFEENLTDKVFLLLDKYRSINVKSIHKIITNYRYEDLISE